MPELSLDEIQALLAGGRAADLIGAVESRTVDFKAEPYLLQSPRKKQELAKDVSAFANAAGGLIVIGLKTEKEPGRATDVVTELRPFPATLLNEEQWRKVIGDWVYPPVMDVQFRRFVADEDRCYLTILVPEQSRSLRPFLVRRTVSTDDQIDGAIVGMFERRHADAQPLSAEELQSIMRDGMLFRAALDARTLATREPPPLAVSPAPAAERPTIPKDLTEATTHRAAALVELMGLAQSATYVLTATPHPPLPGRRMFEATDNAIVRLLMKPAEIRDAGFDMNTGASAEMVGGQSRRSMIEGYKGKELWADGTLVFVARGDEDFLSWGNRDLKCPLTINPVTLIESVLLFCRLTRDIYGSLGFGQGAVEFAICLRRMCPDDKRPILIPGPLHERRARFGAEAAPACEMSAHETATPPLQPEVVAFNLVARVYEWFGLEHDQIPYVDRQNGNQIDAAAIARI